MTPAEARRSARHLRLAAGVFLAVWTVAAVIAWHVGGWFRELFDSLEPAPLVGVVVSWVGASRWAGWADGFDASRRQS